MIASVGKDIVYTVGFGSLFFLLFIFGWVMHKCHVDGPPRSTREQVHYQMQKGLARPLVAVHRRAPWPPPPPLYDSGWVEVVYDRPRPPQVRAKPLALPRGSE